MVIAIIVFLVTLFGECSAPKILFLVFYFIKIFLVFVHFLEMLHTFILCYLIGEFAKFPEILLFFELIILLLYILFFLLFDLMHQLTLIHILLLEFSSSLF